MKIDSSNWIFEVGQFWQLHANLTPFVNHCDIRMLIYICLKSLWSILVNSNYGILSYSDNEACNLIIMSR